VNVEFCDEDSLQMAKWEQQKSLPDLISEGWLIGPGDELHIICDNRSNSPPASTMWNKSNTSKDGLIFVV